MVPACTANMSVPVTMRQPRRRAASRSGVTTGRVMRSATQAAGSSRSISTGSGSSGDMPTGVALTTRSKPAGSDDARGHDAGIARGESPDQAVAPRRVDLGDRERRHARFEERERHRGAGAAGADEQRAPRREPASGLLQRGGHGDAVGHVAAPASAGDAIEHVDAAEHAGALRDLVAMAQRCELVRDGDDDAVEVADALCRSHEGVEVVGRDVNGNADGIDLAGGELGGEPGRRLGLADGIADDDVEPGFAAEGRHRVAGGVTDGS